MDNFFDKAVHYLGRTNPKTYIMNIGAMDGVMFDELIGYTNTYNFKGIYVEPIPYLFEKLKKNITSNGNVFENSAISDYNGEIEMVTIDRDVIDNGLVHSCFYGMSAVYPPKNGLGSEFDRPTVEKYGKKVTVKCITFDKLIRTHRIENIDIIKIDAEGHDYIIFKQIDFEEFRPKVVRLEWINLTTEEQDLILNKFNQLNYKYEISGQDIVGLPQEFYEELSETTSLKIKTHSSYQTTEKYSVKPTIVTGLWNIGRNNLSEGWSRSFDHYIEKLNQLLHIDCNLIIFGDDELKNIVFSIRNEENTQFIYRELSWFKENQYFDKIQKIRSNQDWYNQSSWLKDSTQAKLEMYNPLVMSKMFLLNDACILDKFNSEHLFWIDAGITNTVHQGYFTHDKVLTKLSEKVSDFIFICFPYNADKEIHGFSYPKINEWADDNDIKLVARGGFFGGKKQNIKELNSIYYGLLNETLDRGYMGTEESLFSIMTYKYPNLISYYEIDENGLIGKFFEDLKNGTETQKKITPKISFQNLSNVGLYVIGFNSPSQFNTLIKSFIDYDVDFLNKPKKYLLNNSTDRSTDEEYKRICNLHDFELIWPKENLGICGGRQFVAEHFEKTKLDAYFFFEDDMFFYPNKGEVCRNGFNRYVENLYEKSIKIAEIENFDFLKLNFSEFFGDNSVQWSWYNVPQAVREEYFVGKELLPEHGLDPNAPKTKFNSIKSYQGVPYANGEIFYCNWPQIVSRNGNKKMFLETKWTHPYEQTWMSHMFQETKKGNLNPGILLLTPTEHNRYEHYDRSLRKES